MELAAKSGVQHAPVVVDEQHGDQAAVEEATELTQAPAVLAGPGRGCSQGPRHGSDAGRAEHVAARHHWFCRAADALRYESFVTEET